MQFIKCVQNIGIWTEIKSIYIMYSTSSFLKNQREMSAALGVLTFFIYVTLKTKKPPDISKDNYRRTKEDNYQRYATN